MASASLSAGLPHGLSGKPDNPDNSEAGKRSDEPGLSERRIDLQRLSLAALGWTPQRESGAPVLCVHGWLDNAASFSVLGPLLANNRQVTSIDLPGHGLSDRRPPGYPYHLPDYVQDLADLLRRQTRPVHLVGHSLGGIIGGLLASTAPDKLLSLTLIDSLGPPVSRPEDFPGRLGKGIGKALARERKPMPRYTSVEAAEQARRGGVLPLSAFAAQTLVPRNLQKIEDGWSWRTDPELRNTSLFTLSEEQVAASLAAIEVPVLLLQARDGLLSSERIQRRSAVVRQLTHEVVPGGHHCHIDGDVPGLYAIMDRFLSDASSQTL